MLRVHDGEPADVAERLVLDADRQRRPHDAGQGPDASPPPVGDLIEQQPGGLAPARGEPAREEPVDRARGAVSAAPSPCATRDATMNSATPSCRVRRRPHTSPMRPPSSSSAPDARMQPFTIHGRFTALTSSARWMVGRAMFTIEWSSTSINCAVEIRAER
jgi:hypothetical protein